MIEKAYIDTLEGEVKRLEWELEKDRWIDVNDSLPERPQPAGQYENYLISDGKRVLICGYTSMGVWQTGMKPTHWKKPKPPNC